PGEHHHCIVRWSATDGCDELGLPGESEAYPCELILGDRSSNDGCCSPLYDVGCRRFERAERKTCSVVVRLSGLVVAVNLTEDRESLVECGHRLGGVFYRRDSQFDPACFRRFDQYRSAAGNKERRQALGFPASPRVDNQLRTDPGRIAQ